MGHYEFRDIAPGNYKLRMTPPPGHSATVPAPFVAGAPITVDITVTGGQRTEHNFGLTTRVPIAGLIEGGVFDDVFLDNNPLSTFFEEKAVVTGAPVVVYDHLGYTLDAFQQPSPLCYEAAFNTPLCDRPDLGDEVEIERRLAPGVHIYVGNDPTHPAFNPGYFPLALNYAFGQGTAKFEADWSLLPVTFVQGIPLPGNVVAGNTPLIFPPGFPLVSPNKGFEKKVRTVGFRKRDDIVINNGAVTVTPGTTYRIQGQNFGEAQGYSTVSLLGEALRVVEWHDNYIDVFIPRKALSGSLIVATTTGISNALPIDIPDNSWRRRFKNLRFVYVDASNTGPEDGSKFHPWNTINEALNHLPKRKPRYIIVAPGTYNERIHITESNIKLIGAGPHETTIDGRAGQFIVDESGASTAFGPVIHIGNGPNSKKHVRNVVISGFTITGGTVNSDDIGAGIFGDYDNRFIDINNCIIVQNGGYYGGGIWLYKNNHNVRIWSNLIAENGNFGGFAGGISVNDEPYSTDQDPQPEHLPDDFNPGPPPGTYEIFNNLIFHNWSPDAGGGVTLYEVKDHLKVYGNVIAENFAYDHGGGMFFEDCGPVDVYGNIFLRNVCYDDGGAISFEDVGDTLSHVNVYNNLFAQNIADDKGENHARGAALAFDDTFYGKVFNNTITGNIVAGSEDPAGGAIDSERNGHEYSGLDGPFKAPGYSDPQISNNIIWDNWRLHYDQPIDAGEEEDLDYTYGRNYVWIPDELHVDNPALQGEWETDKNSESFTHVRYNDIAGGYLSGVNNLDVDPMFVDPSNSNWRLKAGSPVIDHAKASLGPNVDLELITRTPSHGKIDMGAFEWHAGPIIVRLPTGILNAIQVPVPGSPSPNP